MDREELNEHDNKILDDLHKELDEMIAHEEYMDKVLGKNVLYNRRIGR